MKNFTLLDKMLFTLVKRKIKKHALSQAAFFTFVELLLILAIIGIVTGLILPKFQRSRNAAGFDRWLKYNESLNQKPGTVANFNFQEYGDKLNIDGIMTPCVENLAKASDLKNFDAKKYAAIMVNNPEWLPHGGRWYEKGAVQFNGTDQCLYIAGSDAFDFLRAKNEFTIYFWIYYYSEPSGTIFTKGEEGGKQQYAMFIYDSRIQAVAGKEEVRCEQKIYKRKWYHVGVVNKPGSGLKIFVDGKVQATRYIKSKSGVDFKNGKRLTIGASSRTKTRNIVNSRNGKTETENYYSLTACFRGKIDEIVILRRAMSPKELNIVYKTGRGAPN